VASSQTPVERFLYSVPDAGVALGGLSERSIRYLIHKGDLQTRRSGSRTLITRESIRRYACMDHPDPIRPQKPTEADSAV
jgi:hypothetical protein